MLKDNTKEEYSTSTMLKTTRFINPYKKQRSSVTMSTLARWTASEQSTVTMARSQDNTNTNVSQNEATAQTYNGTNFVFNIAMMTADSLNKVMNSIMKK